MNYTRLLKLLYLAERESIRETAQPITGDHVYALKNGPVLSRTYDCIKGDDPAAATWSQAIRRSGDWDVELSAAPSMTRLSEFEVQLLRRVAEKFRGFDVWELVEHTHTLPEWQKNAPPPNTRNFISPGDILSALGWGEEVDDILEEARYHAHFDRLLGWAEGEAQTK